MFETLKIREEEGKVRVEDEKEKKSNEHDELRKQ
jgi:hypothetical protein